MGAVSNGTFDVSEALDTLERKVHTLEVCAKKRLGSRDAIPPPPSQREFRNVRAMYNAVDSAVLRLEKCVAALPRSAVEGRSHIQADLIDYDPGEKYFKLVETSVGLLIAAACEIGKLKSEFGPAAASVQRQAELLGVCVQAEATLISKAAKMAKPQNPAVLQEHCETLVEASIEVSELKYEVDVRSPLHNHAMALADTAAALGWVVAPAPVKHVREYKNIVTGLTESILARYIDLGCNPIHSDFAESLNAFVESLADYVHAEHPAGLRWNYAEGAIPLGYRRVERKIDPNAHPFGDFYKIYHGALARYYSCSRELGGAVAKQAEGVVGVYTELAKAIEGASGKPRPSGTSEPELRMLLMSLQHELVALPSIVSTAPRDYKFMDHLNVMQEVISVMQWCTSSLNKMSPVSFIIDIQGVTNMYLDRLEATHAGPIVRAEKHSEEALSISENEPYAKRLHREWVQAVRDMLVELNDYVKTHHPNGLTFDTQRSRKSMELLVQKSFVSSELAECKTTSTARKWKLIMVRKNVGGVRREVPAWR
jgi:hypothetical protein